MLFFHSRPVIGINHIGNGVGNYSLCLRFAVLLNEAYLHIGKIVVPG
jgi:hypothetical protein